MDEQKPGLFFQDIGSIGRYLKPAMFPASIISEDGGVAWYCSDERALNSFRRDMEAYAAKRTAANQPVLLEVKHKK
jgi:hypothetical protein